MISQQRLAQTDRQIMATVQRRVCPPRETKSGTDKVNYRSLAIVYRQSMKRH
jgi:hypothetical protein